MINFKFNKESFNPTAIKNACVSFLLKSFGLFFMLFFVIFAVISFFYTYKYIYTPTWSEEQKNNYLQESRKNNIDFKITEFNSIIEIVEKRNEDYKNNKIEKVKDIFGIKEKNVQL